MHELPASIPAPGSDVFRLSVSRHAAERFVDRVRPGLLVNDGAQELARLSGTGSLQPQAPDWLRTEQRPAFYLLLTPDIAVPVDLASNGSYHARTVLTRPVAKSRTRQQQRRQARRKRRAMRDRRTPSLSRPRRGHRRRAANVHNRGRWEHW